VEDDELSEVKIDDNDMEEFSLVEGIDKLMS
jgi:hypothetical protein